MLSLHHWYDAGLGKREWEGDGGRRQRNAANQEYGDERSGECGCGCEQGHEFWPVSVFDLIRNRSRVAPSSSGSSAFRCSSERKIGVSEWCSSWATSTHGRAPRLSLKNWSAAARSARCWGRLSGWVWVAGLELEWEVSVSVEDEFVPWTV